jgi:hypothetical protein
MTRRAKDKAKLKVGQVVSFGGSKMIYVRIHGIAEAGLERTYSFFRNGVLVKCGGNLLRPLTRREKGSHDQASER